MITPIFGYSIGGYEWAQFSVYAHPLEKGKYATDMQSGCSCNGYEPPSKAKISSQYPRSRTQVRYEFSQWFEGTKDRYENYGTKVAALEKLNDSL